MMSTVLNLPAGIFNLPVNFSQVREDSLLDQRVVEQLKNSARVLMIASGGDTLCHLASLPQIKQIEVIDASEAQLNLAKIKLALLGFSRSNRLALLGHQMMLPEIRYEILNEIAQELKIPLNSIGPKELVAEEGLDFIGRYEQLFKCIQEELDIRNISPASLLSQPKVLEEIFETYFSLPLLVQLFGEKATQNPYQSFALHFYRQTINFIATGNSLHSPYFQQMLFGQFSLKSYPWHELPGLTSKEIAQVTFKQSFMLNFLRSCESGTYDFIHLSNILDWLSIDEAEELLFHSYRVLAKGGKCLIRQLNSSLDIPQLCSKFHWNKEFSRELTLADRSFFYRNILVGEK